MRTSFAVGANGPHPLPLLHAMEKGEPCHSSNKLHSFLKHRTPLLQGEGTGVRTVSDGPFFLHPPAVFLV